MDTFIGVAVLSALGYGVYKLAQAGYEHAARRRYQAAIRAGADQKLRQRIRRLNLLARRLQLALLQLDGTPDFRRAAAVAAQAKEVPLVFRQRQFRRFRGRLVAHMAACLRAGGVAEPLVQSLAELLQHLGIAGYEADYIKVEAEQQRPNRKTPVPATYEQQLARLKSEHERRVETLKTSGLDKGMLERLVEEEDERFRESLLNLGNDQAATPNT